MLPDFTHEGFLPPGIYTSTWDDFQLRFAKFSRSDRRPKVCQQLGLLIEVAKRSSIVERIYVGGSLVTDKSEPNDFDCILVANPTIVGDSLTPSDYNLLSRRTMRKQFGGDVLSAISGTDAQAEYLEFFQTSRDDIALASWRFYYD